MSEKLTKKFPGNSPDATFSPCFTERFSQNPRKSRGKFRGEIFPSGGFPDFPKFSRREIFSTKFHRNITNKLYVYNWLQPVNQYFAKFVTWYFRGKLLQENFSEKSVATFSPEISEETFPGKSFLPFWENTGNTPWEKLMVLGWPYIYTTRVWGAFLYKNVS